MFDSGLNKFENALSVGGVAAHGQAVAAQLLDFRDGCLDRLETTAGGDDLDATLSQAQGDTLADTLAGAGYDRDLLVQLLHDGFPLSRCVAAEAPRVCTRGQRIMSLQGVSMRTREGRCRAGRAAGRLSTIGLSSDGK